jgi:chromosomal replication initiator protein
MLTRHPQETWSQFLEFAEERCSATEFANWLAPIRVLDASAEDEIVLEVPNIFVRQYLLDNYTHDLASFLPVKPDGSLAIAFVVAEPKKRTPAPPPTTSSQQEEVNRDASLNAFYKFEHFIEGPANQFVKSAAMSVASRPGKTYNPLVIHGGVGLGKTHLLHAIGHHVKERQKKLRVQCITTEAFINDLVDGFRNKSIDRLKRYYRSLDVLLVDDIQFLRSNFEEEFCNLLESLINQGKQVVITSDKPPGQLQLSERMIARMEWGLVAHIGIPDFETRVAILQHKAEQRGLRIPHKTAYFIAEHIFNNVRQLEGALNRLGAYCRIMGTEVTEEVVEKTLSGMLQSSPQKKITVDQILKCVAAIFGVRVSDIRGSTRTKEIAFARQVAMYLAKELINESLMKLASSFGGKTHSTLLHAWKKVSEQVPQDEVLRRQIQLAKRNLEGAG